AERGLREERAQAGAESRRESGIAEAAALQREPGRGEREVERFAGRREERRAGLRSGGGRRPGPDGARGPRRAAQRERGRSRVRLEVERETGRARELEPHAFEREVERRRELRRRKLGREARARSRRGPCVAPIRVTRREESLGLDRPGRDVGLRAERLG